jgi:hypothetical protein
MKRVKHGIYDDSNVVHGIVVSVTATQQAHLKFDSPLRSNFI